MTSVLQRSVGWTFLVALGFVPLAFGANVPLAWGINAGVFGGLLVLFSLAQALSRNPPSLTAGRLAVPLITFGAVMLWIYVQGQTWTPAWMHAPEWARASDLLGEPLPGRISVNPGETHLGLLRLATATAVFLLALQLGADPQWAKRIVAAMAIAAAVQATYALALAAMGPDMAARLLPPSLFKLEQREGLTGTFYNRSHFAVYVGLGLVSTWGLLSRDLRMGMVDHGFRDRREVLAKIVGVGRGLARYSVLLMPLGIGILLSASRAGILLAFSAIFLMLFIDRGQLAGSKTWRFILLGIAIVGSVLAVTTQSEIIGSRLERTTYGINAGDPHRVAAGKIALRAIEARPLLGYGYGSFASVFPHFRDSSLPFYGRWKEAHNSYLEAILGLGIPMAGVLFAGFASIVGVCIRGVAKRRRDRLAPIVAVAASLLVGAQVLVDFSIQIQGVALGFAALLGAGYAQSWSSRDRGGA